MVATDTAIPQGLYLLILLAVGVAVGVVAQRRRGHTGFKWAIIAVVVQLLVFAVCVGAVAAEGSRLLAEPLGLLTVQLFGLAAGAVMLVVAATLPAAPAGTRPPAGPGAGAEGPAAGVQGSAGESPVMALVYRVIQVLGVAALLWAGSILANACDEFRGCAPVGVALAWQVGLGGLVLVALGGIAADVAGMRRPAPRYFEDATSRPSVWTPEDRGPQSEAYAVDWRGVIGLLIVAAVIAVAVLRGQP